MTQTTAPFPGQVTLPGPARPPEACKAPSIWARWRADGAAIALGTALITWHGTRFGQWMVDDAAIAFAYARSIDEGFGPVQQPGADPVEGYSNPAWLGLLIIGRRLGLFDHRAILGVPDLVLYPKVLGVLCALGILLAIAFAARSLVSRSWIVTGLAGVLLAGNASFVGWMVSGLENPLYALTATILASLLIQSAVAGDLLSRGPAAASGLLALAAALTRPDGAVLAGAYPLLLLLSLRGRAGLRPRVRAAALAVAVFAVPYTAFLAWRYAAFGHLMPYTSVAKAQEPPDAEAFTRTTGVLLTYTGWHTLFLAVALTGAALARRAMPATAMTAVLLPLTLTLCAFGVLEQDWMEMYRSATPLWPLGALAVTLSVVSLAEQGTPRARATVAAAVSGMLLLSFAAQRQPAADFRANATLPKRLIVYRHGVAFHEYADRPGLRDTSVVLPSLGGTPYRTCFRLPVPGRARAA